MSYWKTLAASALLLPAMAGGTEVIGTADEVAAALAERELASGWERIEIPSDPKNPDTTIIRTNASGRPLQPAPEFARGADHIF